MGIILDVIKTMTENALEAQRIAKEVEKVKARAKEENLKIEADAQFDTFFKEKVLPEIGKQATKGYRSASVGTNGFWKNKYLLDLAITKLKKEGFQVCQETGTFQGSNESPIEEYEYLYVTWD